MRGVSPQRGDTPCHNTPILVEPPSSRQFLWNLEEGIVYPVWRGGSHYLK